MGVDTLKVKIHHIQHFFFWSNFSCVCRKTLFSTLCCQNVSRKVCFLMKLPGRWHTWHHGLPREKCSRGRVGIETSLVSGINHPWPLPNTLNMQSDSTRVFIHPRAGTSKEVLVWHKSWVHRSTHRGHKAPELTWSATKRTFQFDKLFKFITVILTFSTTLGSHTYGYDSLCPNTRILSLCTDGKSHDQSAPRRTIESAGLTLSRINHPCLLPKAPFDLSDLATRVAMGWCK